MLNEELNQLQGTDTQQQAQQEHQQPEANQDQSQTTEDRAASNFRRLREKADRAERERDEAMRRLQELEARASQASTQSDDDDVHIAPDDLAEGKHLSKVTQKIKRLENELKQYKQQSTVDSAEARLKAQYADFDKVVSRENIEALRDAYPELATSIHSTPDIYSRAVSAYTMIKKMGIYQDSQQYSADREIAQRNAAKPKPTASISPQQGDSPLSKANAFANGLTKELKAQLIKEMAESRRAH